MVGVCSMASEDQAFHIRYRLAKQWELWVHATGANGIKGEPGIPNLSYLLG